MTDIEVTVEGDVLVVEATTTVTIEQEIVTDLNGEQITLVLTDATTEVVVEPAVLLGVNVAGLQGPRGVPGAGNATLVEAASIVLAYHVVALDADGRAFVASADQLGTASTVLGISTVGALAGESVLVVTDGLLDTGPHWTPGPLFLGLSGELVADPSLAQFQLQVAVAITPSLLIVRPQFPITL